MTLGGADHAAKVIGWYALATARPLDRVRGARAFIGTRRASGLTSSALCPCRSLRDSGDSSLCPDDMGDESDSQEPRM